MPWCLIVECRVVQWDCCKNTKNIYLFAILRTVTLQPSSTRFFTLAHGTRAIYTLRSAEMKCRHQQAAWKSLSNCCVEVVWHRCFSIFHCPPALVPLTTFPLCPAPLPPTCWQSFKHLRPSALGWRDDRFRPGDHSPPLARPATPGSRNAPG